MGTPRAFLVKVSMSLNANQYRWWCNSPPAGAQVIVQRWLWFIHLAPIEARFGVYCNHNWFWQNSLSWNPFISGTIVHCVAKNSWNRRPWRFFIIIVTYWMCLVFEILYFFTDKICKYRVLSKLNTAIIDRMPNWYQPFAGILYALRRMSEICNLQALRTLKFVLIHSYISHGISHFKT